MTLKVTVNSKNLPKVLRRVANEIGSRRMLGAIGARHLKFIKDNFRDGGKENKWPSLSRNTIAARRRGGSRPLQDTGRLRASFDFRTGSRKVSVGTSHKYAKIHDEGTRPYVIRPKNGKYLVFNTANGIVTTNKVNHPGVPKRQMLPSKQMGGKLAVKVATEILRKAAKG